MGLIYLDACLLIYAVEAHPVFGPIVVQALASEPPSRLAISPLTRMECLVQPLRTGNAALQRRYELSFSQLAWLPMHDMVFEAATQLRAHHGLKTPDALHLALAQHHGCAALWTNDDRLARAAHGLAVNVLKPASA